MSGRESIQRALHVPLTFCISPLNQPLNLAFKSFRQQQSLCTIPTRNVYNKVGNRKLTIRCQQTPAAESASQTVLSRGHTLAVVGLGNPGRNFNGTRHNIGFDVVTALAATHGASFSTNRSLEAEVARVNIGERDVLLVRPRTYMNASGRTVRKLKLPTRALLIVADDMALDVGRVKLRARGSAGGHNGLKSIETAIGGREYARLRIGVGEAGGPDQWRDHVLGSFSRAERTELEGVVIDCCNVIEEWIKHDDIQRPIDLLSRLMGNKKNVKR